MNHVHQILLTESQGFLDAGSLPAAFTHLRKLAIPEATSPSLRRAQSYAFIDWSLRSALPWLLLTKGATFRRVAKTFMVLPAIVARECPIADVEEALDAATAVLHDLNNWKRVAKYRAIDDMLGCAGDALAAVNEAERLIFTHGEPSAVHEELERGVTFAAQMLVAGGDRKPFDAATVVLGVWGGVPEPEHGTRMVKRVVRVDLSVRLPITRWCAKCRMTIAVDARSEGCPHCEAAWEADVSAPTSGPVVTSAPDADLCPVAMGS